MAYGDKRDYPKIDISVNGQYVCSTTWSKTPREAVQNYHGYGYEGDAPYGVVTARFAKGR